MGFSSAKKNSTGCFSSLFGNLRKAQTSEQKDTVAERLPAYEECITSKVSLVISRFSRNALEHFDVKADTEIEKIVYDTIDNASSELREISLELHRNPELGMHEYHSHDLLTEFLERKGFKVTRHAYGMETAFTAEFTNGPGRRVGLCSEYDGLKGLGQGCGHNLIAISGVGAAMALKAALESGRVKGKVILYGTPAEEITVGKVIMCNLDVFKKNVDVCMMIHPSPGDTVYHRMLAVDHVNVEFFGKPSHAAGKWAKLSQATSPYVLTCVYCLVAAPWNGINALDAIAQTWNNISMLRQQILPTDRMHGIITDGGKAANIIPDYASATFFIRSLKISQLDELKPRVEKCFEAAAVATGCKVKYSWKEVGVTKDVLVNSVMGDRYTKYMESYGISYIPKSEQEQMSGGSTDAGNISYQVPLVHPGFGIHTTAVNHTHEFTAAAKTEIAHEDTLRATKAMSMTLIDILQSQDMLDAAVAEFKKNTA
ncbi:hypothetical protein INT44_008830 [Umbelopsis vinacea]|uniref:Peptidase M20 dimerisation domain-containing protein n=1 Tax=Umbelopsis vinacea TaxID=44442 RepID=A0A8H7UM38_9FUNG|nr:hypothetical protein INT44_008830 [Umbelopsis vinacea]